MGQGLASQITADSLAGQRRRVTGVVVGQNVSTLGDSLLLVFVPLMVFGLTHSAIQVAVAYVATRAPTLAAMYATAPRRWLSSKSLLVIYDVTRCGLMVLIAALAALPSPESYLPLIYAALAGKELLSSWFRPTRISFITELVEPALLSRFNSLDRMFEALTTAAGAALAGFAYEFLPLSAAFLLTALTFLASGLLLAFYGPAVAANGRKGGQPRPARFRHSAWSFARNPVTRGLVGGETLTGIAFGVYGALFVIYVRKGLHASGAAFGLLEALQATVATAAGLLMATRVWKVRTGLTACLGYGGMAVALIIVGFTHSIAATAGLMVVYGAGNMFYAVGVRTLLQRQGSGDELVQLFALESILSRSAQVAGAGAAGIIVATAVLSPAHGLALAGGVILLVTAIALRVARNAA